MKIGIMLSDQLPEIGGGFTFEHGIVESVHRLRAETPHELVLIGATAERPAGLSELPWISMKPRLEKTAKVRREIKRIFKRLLPRGKKARQQTLLFDFQRAPQIQAADLDLIVYLNPFISPFLDIPFIINVWDLAHRLKAFFPEISMAGEWEVRERMYRERLQRAAYILTPNETAKREIVDFYQVPPEKVRPLHHPTPNDVLQHKESTVATSLAHLGLRGDYLFCPAQFWPHKNHMLLLRMLKVLKAKYDYEPQLVLTGSDKQLFHYALDGNLSYIKEQTRAMGLENQVIFAGFVAREILIALYRGATALVFPSFLGPENLPPLEAFALGCPVIATELPGSRDQFGDAAIQLDPKSPELWADTVQKLRQDAGLRARQIEKGKARAKLYTSDDFLRGLFGIFEEFEAYRCNWTSAISKVPIKPGGVSLHPPCWETRYTPPRV